MARITKAEFNSEYKRSEEEVREIVNGLGFPQQELAEAKKLLSSYIPREVLFEEFSGDRGRSLLYALYAPELLKAFKRMSDKQKFMYLDGGAKTPLDFVQDAMTGMKSDGTFTKGVFTAVTPSTPDQTNPHAYEPTLGGEKPTICPHCGVSFWSSADGNGDPRWKEINGKAIPEWRENEADAPDPLKINVTDSMKYKFCNGRHEIFPIGNSQGVDFEKAMELTGKSLEQLESEGRYRRIRTDDGQELHVIVDEYLPVVENMLAENGKPDRPYKTFSEEWIVREGDKMYRQCRHPVDLKAPNSFIMQSVSHFTDKDTTNSKQVEVFKCPYVDIAFLDSRDPAEMYSYADTPEQQCSGVFRDLQGITKKPLDIDGKPLLNEDGTRAEPTHLVTCDTCYRNFDIRDEQVESYKYKHNFNSAVSIDTPVGSADDSVGSIGDLQVAPASGDDIRLELDELMSDIMDEIRRISDSLKINGADKAAEIFYDWRVNGLSLRDITNKYFNDDYQLHFTECLDCGFTKEEKSNPSKGQVEGSYSRGLPINMTRCPNAKNHDVTVEPEVLQTAPEEADPWAEFEEEQEGKAKSAPAPTQTTEISDPEVRKALEGTNLVYHGVDGSFLVDKSLSADQRKLEPSDPRSYDGSKGVITYHIYAPAERLLSAICKKLVDSKVVNEKFCDGLEYIQALRDSRTVRGFCRS